MELENEPWPYSLKELTAAKTILFQKISFIDIMKKHSGRIEQCWHSDFTHKALCPQHSSGQEKTPSFYFSEKTKSFHCFGCAIHGDVFDFLSYIEGRPSFWIISDFLTTEHISQENMDQPEVENAFQNYDIIHSTNFDMSIQLRDYLSTWKNHSKYEDEKLWVDWMFSRIDDRFAIPKDLTGDQAKSFKIQTLMELNRRKALMKRKHSDWNA